MFANRLVFEAIASLLTITLCSSLESPDPEIFLQPRNYNPHPYEGAPFAIAALRRPAAPIPESARRGPVLFPGNPEDGGQSIVQDREGAHPYAGVARKQKIKLGGRFTESDQENNINPRVYSGLANYAAKVLKKPAATAQHNGYPDPSLSGHKKNYAFSYTGDDFSHSQSQNSRATKGEYRVNLPDGRVQIVSYTADQHGYKADVKYADEPPIQHRDYDYYDEPQGTQVEMPAYDSRSYQPRQEYVTIYPKYVLAEKSRKYQQPHNVQIQHYNGHGYDGGVVVSTVAPPRYSQVYITTPKYSVAHGSRHPASGGNYYKKR